MAPRTKKIFSKHFKGDSESIQKAETALSESEERFRTLVETLNSGVAIYKVINKGKSGSDYIVQSFNKFALNHEGLSLKEVIGRSLEDIRPNIDKYGLIDVFRKVWETGKPEFFPAKIYKDEKFSNYYENRVFRLPNREIVAVYDDVTAHKEAENIISENELKLRRIFENIQDVFYEVTIEGAILEISPSVKSLSKGQYERAELIGKNLSDLYSNPEQRGELLRKLSKKGVVTDYEINLKNRDASIVPCSISAKILKNNDGVPVKIIGSMRDNTERKESEKVLVRLKGLLAETERTANIGGWIFDPVTKEQEWTDQVFRILEIDMSEGAPKVPEGLNFIDPAFRPMAEEAIGRAVQKGEPYDQEWIVTTARGNKKWVHAIARPKLKDGKVVRISGAFQDITEKKKFEQELIKYRDRLEELVKERTSELEAKNKELERYFDAFVERELRTKELFEENEKLKQEVARLREGKNG